MMISRTETTPRRVGWTVFSLLLLLAGIAGTVLYGWIIAAVFLIAVMLPDFAYATISKILDGLAHRRARNRTQPVGEAPPSSASRRIKLYNAIHNWRLPAAVIADGGIIWALGWPGGRETAFAGCAWLLHVAIDNRPPASETVAP